MPNDGLAKKRETQLYHLWPVWPRPTELNRDEACTESRPTGNNALPPEPAKLPCLSACVHVCACECVRVCGQAVADTSKTDRRRPEAVGRRAVSGSTDHDDRTCGNKRPPLLGPSEHGLAKDLRLEWLVNVVVIRPFQPSLVHSSSHSTSSFYSLPTQKRITRFRRKSRFFSVPRPRQNATFSTPLKWACRRRG
ncbi:unnamed protein product [Protopolystoma xenopodis]|uniref:Uncharacterized protein n=1 Tax=Protopolystoma xenopodis TaxID=117903 RepID=A0A448WIG6_9PLAT|nr:unnamed protein product [Protopolystoma xenopodis]